MSIPALAARGLRYRYPSSSGNDTPAALRGVDFELPCGGYVALIGQNGAGKTTLAKHFNGLLRATSGEVRVSGRAVADTPISTLAREVGFVFQNPDHQIFSPSVREEIAAGPRNLGASEHEIERRIDETLSRFGLADHAHRPPAVLSFALRRAVAVAAVFAMDTPVLVLDEPSAGLDARHVANLLARIDERLARGHSVVLITHDMRLVAENVPRCLVMHEGRVVADGDSAGVLGDQALLRDAHLEAPQVTRLARRVGDWGMPPDIFSVDAFCERFARLRARAGSGRGPRE